MQRSIYQGLLFIGGIGLALILHSCGTSRASSGASTSSYSDIRKEYAEELKVRPSELERIELYAAVEDWRGTPYRYGGQSKSGVDCSGFVGQLYREVYEANLPRQVEAIYKACDRRFTRKRKLEEGDLVFFDIKGGKASHAGVYLKNGRFVHASSSSGVVISKLSNPYYRKHFYRGGRIR